MSKAIISLDVGDKRIGVALSPLDAKIPRPLKALENNATVYKNIRDLIIEHDAATVVIGLPMDMNYEKTEQTERVENFSNILKSRVRVPVYFQNETLTSDKAKKELQNKGKSFEKGDVDALAATFILEDFIDQNHEIIEEITNG